MSDRNFKSMSEPTSKEVHMDQQFRTDQVRQGDVLLTQTTAAKGKPQPRAARLVVQEGEATGHAHAIAEPDARLMLDEDRRFLRIVGAATITHEEHAPIELAPAEYDVTIHEEWTDDMEPRQVRD